ncbi:MAG: (4Fe-4S)-binding protein [Nocardioidaceae bacterium]
MGAGPRRDRASRASSLDVPGLGEAAAALQDLALGLADAAGEGEPYRRAGGPAVGADPADPGRARRPVSGDEPRAPVRPPRRADPDPAADGAVPVRGVGIKPTCDGACHRIGFTTAKDPNRVADRRDSYVGQSVTVLDNRGTCQHSGLCTDRLASVFHLG